MLAPSRSKARSRRAGLPLVQACAGGSRSATRRGDAALAFKGAELERRERQRADLGDELLLALGGDEARLVAQAPGGGSAVREEGELFGHESIRAMPCRSYRLPQAGNDTAVNSWVQLHRCCHCPGPAAGCRA